MKENKEEDFDFDFSIYKGEEEKEEVIESLKNLKRPRITGLKSRFSPGESELARLGELNSLISKYGIKVASRVQDLPTLWKFYGVCEEYWASIKNIMGSLVIKEVKKIQDECVGLLEKHKTGAIDPKVHKRLLFFRNVLYRLRQLHNLSFEVEKTSKSVYSKTKRKIVEG